MSVVNDSETGRLRRKSEAMEEKESQPLRQQYQPKQKSISHYETGASLPSIMIWVIINEEK